MRVLVLCTANSCRSIIAEALIKHYLKFDVKSAGERPKKEIHPLAKKVLQEEGIWSDSFYSKGIDEVLDEEFDIVITVCDRAKESCPNFPKKIQKLHIPFKDPDGKGYEAFVKRTKRLCKRDFCQL